MHESVDGDAQFTRTRRVRAFLRNGLSKRCTSLWMVMRTSPEQDTNKHIKITQQVRRFISLCVPKAQKPTFFCFFAYRPKRSASLCQDPSPRSFAAGRDRPSWRWFLGTFCSVCVYVCEYICMYVLFCRLTWSTILTLVSRHFLLRVCVCMWVYMYARALLPPTLVSKLFLLRVCTCVYICMQ